MIFAHRGASGQAPENTMAAFRKAVEMGAEAIELDVQLTKDGEVVIFHDDSLARTTNGSGLLKEHTFEELRELDAGGWFHPSYAGEKVPSLAEFLEYIRTTPLFVNIELKNLPFFYAGMERKVVDLVHSFGMADRVLISSFDHYALETTAQLAPSLPLGVLLDTRLIKPWEYISRLPFAVASVHPHFAFVDPEFVRECHNRAYKVIAYTVDQPEWYEKGRQFGLDGIFTNFPERFH